MNVPISLQFQRISIRTPVFGHWFGPPFPYFCYLENVGDKRMLTLEGEF